MRLEDVTFDAVDGEGFDDEEGHHYNLLVASCFDTGWTMTCDAGRAGFKQLPTNVCLRALTELGRTKNRIHVAFYFSYDVTKWVEDLTQDQRVRLFHGGEILYQCPEHREDTYIIHYIPSKQFTVRYFRNGVAQRRVVIHDVFSYFQCSFVKALKNWGLTKEIEFIEEMKAKRGKFSQEDSEETSRYSLMETDLLCQLMNRVRDALVAEDIPMEKFYGSGSIAEAIFDKHEMGPHIRRPDWYDSVDFVGALFGAYFGGRFELFKQGIFQTSHQYDINSAYPSAMAKLPSFRNCIVRPMATYNPTSRYSIWFVTYNVPKHISPIGPLPYRTKDGQILFPFKNEHGVWIHQVELEAVLQLYGDRYFKIHRGFSLESFGNTKVFQFIPVYAKRRLELKKAGDMRNIVLKLGLNALYGKTAQSLTSKGLPPYQNFFIAGYVTAATRAKLLRFAFTCGRNGSGVIQFATDGVFTTIPSSVQQTVSHEGLGDWEYTYLDRPTIYLKPGVYFVQRKGEENARVTKRRTRGFRATSFTVNEVFREWQHNGPYGQLTTVDKRFVGIGTCIVLQNWDNYGRFIPWPLEIKFGPGATKWYTYGHELAIGGGEDGNTRRYDYYLLEPYQRKVNAESLIYQPKFQDKVLTIDDYDAETQINIIAESFEYDQPDYEKYRVFGDAEPKE